MMAPHADKHQGGGVESIAGGRKRKAAERSGSRDSAGQKASNSKGDGVEPFREKKQQPKHRYRGMVVMAGQVEGRVGAPAATKGKEKSEGKGGTKGKGKGKSAIDDIFADVKRLKEAKAEENAERVVAKKKAREEHKRRQENPFTGEGAPAKRWAWADEVKPVRYDEDGLPIYTWDSLRIGQGGGTDLCPFDCDCCF